MTLCKRLVITAAVVLLVISQLLAVENDSPFANRRFTLDQPLQLDVSQIAVPACPAGLVQTDTKDKNGQPVRICSVSQEKTGDVYKLHQRVGIHARAYNFSADEVEYNNDTGEAVATGHIHLTGGAHDEDVRAARAHYNVRDETGRFEDVDGSIGLKRTPRRLVLTSSSPFLFTGKIVDKTGPEHYVVHQGRVTVCDQPTPMWSLSS